MSENLGNQLTLAHLRVVADSEKHAPLITLGDWPIVGELRDSMRAKGCLANVCRPTASTHAACASLISVSTRRNFVAECRSLNHRDSGDRPCS